MQENRAEVQKMLAEAALQQYIAGDCKALYQAWAEPKPEGRAMQENEIQAFLEAHDAHIEELSQQIFNLVLRRVKEMT